MQTAISRITTALALAASLGTGLVAPIAARQTQGAPPPPPPARRTQTPTAQPQPTAKNDNKKVDTKKADDKKAKSQQQTARALGTNEDPSQIGKRKINKGIISKMSGSVEGDVRTGRQYAMQIDREAKFVDDPVITEYVNRVGQNIVLHSDAKVPFTIKVIDSDEVNAFALPGGFFYVHKGLILAADNEAELAGVMAHEIAHVAARHHAETNTKSSILQYVALGGTILTGGALGSVIYNASSLLIPVSFFAFSRGAEREADTLGVQYLYAAGYDPTGMSTMFEKLASKNKKKPGFFSKAFSTHPQSTDRLEASRTLVARFPEREEYVLSTSEFQRVKSRLLRLSNAKATTVGDISGENGAPGRPTLKRRQSTPDETTATPDANPTSQPSQAPQNERPTLRRRDPVPATTTTTPPAQP